MQPRSSVRGERLRVAVLMGGPSSEHEISLQGGQNVVEALDSARYEVRPVVIARDGTWRVRPRALKARRNGHAPAFDPRDSDGWRAFPSTLHALTFLKDWGVDVVLPVLHGRFGEDGTLQACLAAADVPFVGSGSLGSGLANDKARAKEIFRFHGIATPAFEVLDASQLSRRRVETAERLVATYGTPLVLKDPCGGSSLEVRIADDVGEVATCLQELAPPASRVLVEAYVGGRELTAGVIDDLERGEAIALPVVEIRPRQGRSFDYFEKYNADGAEELCPAPISGELEEEARAIGLKVHRIFGLRGISRTDLILDVDERLHVLEVNTLPGMTERGLVPLAAGKAGISFPALVENLVRRAGVS